MGALVSNNATGTLATAISSSATLISLSVGQGALFPSPSGSQYFKAVLVDALNNIEIIKVTLRAGDGLTAVRGQEGTTARGYNAGDKLELRMTADVLNSKADLDGAAFTGDVSTIGVFRGSLVGNADTASNAAHATNADHATAADTATNATHAADAATLTGPLGIALGGTGGTDQPTARTGLGLGSASTHPASDFKAAGDVESIDHGGTGASLAVDALHNLGGVPLAGTVPMTGSIATTPYPVTSILSTNIDCSKSNVFRLPMTANITTLSLSNMLDGQTINIRIKQDGTGNRTIAWPSSFKWPAAVVPVLSTAANARDLLVLTYWADEGYWDADLSKGRV